MNDRWADILLASENYPDDKREPLLLEQEGDAQDQSTPHVDRHQSNAV